MKLMLFRKILPLFAASALSISAGAHAQLAAYATVTGERLSGLTCLDPLSQCAATGGVVHPYGANFGGYYDFRTIGPVRFGVDLRGNVFSTSKSAQSYQASSGLLRQYSALGGLRASFATPLKFIRPYGEFAVGYAKTNAAGYSTTTGINSYSNYTEAEGLVGVDVPVASFLSIRAIEFGGGALFGPNTHAVESIGAGVVFHTSR